MKTDPVTFGAYISEARKRKGLSQKELALLVRREEDDKCISPQYLNDIEHDRRSPSSDHLIQQFAAALDLKVDYLHYLAGNFPEEIRKRHLSEDQVEKAFMAFRKGS